MSRVNMDWIKQIKGTEEKKEFISLLKTNPVIDRLKEILETKLRTRDTFKETDYTNPSWAYSVADRNGYVRAIKELLKLLTTEGK